MNAPILPPALDALLTEICEELGAMALRSRRVLAEKMPSFKCNYGGNVVGGPRRKGFFRSTTAAARNTSSSAPHCPTIWTPTGSPVVVKPIGTDTAGWPVIFQGNV
jgi:hypothetical protein